MRLRLAAPLPITPISRLFNWLEVPNLFALSEGKISCDLAFRQPSAVFSTPNRSRSPGSEVDGNVGLN
jgi:hypothetical protein